MKPTMYINTCDATMYFLPIMLHFFQKYWPDQEAKILGYAEPTFDTPFEYISMAPTQIGEAKGWANYLYQYFNSIDDEIILWGIDDHIIAEHVNKDIVDYFVKRMEEDETIGRVGLTYGITTREHAVIDRFDDFDVVELDQKAKYRVSTEFGLWRKSYLLKLLKPDWTPWDFEILGSSMIKNDGMKILATSRRNIAVHKVEGKRNFTPRGKVNLLGVKFMDIIELIDLGLVPQESIIGEQDWL